MNAPLETVLAEYRARLEAVYGSRLQRLVLFGSRARGDADPESDIDVLIVLEGKLDDGQERQRLSFLNSELSLKYETVISATLTTADTLDRSGLPFYRNVRREGVPV